MGRRSLRENPGTNGCPDNDALVFLLDPVPQDVTWLPPIRPNKLGSIFITVSIRVEDTDAVFDAI